MRPALALFAAFALAGCTVSPDLPDDAELFYHGYSGNTMGTLPYNNGRVYIVDARTGKVVIVTFVKDDPTTPEAPTLTVRGLKTDRKYSFYIVPVKPDAPAE